MHASHGNGDHEMQVTTRLLEPNAEEFKFKIPSLSSLLEMMQQGAGRAHAALLPTEDAPLDRPAYARIAQSFRRGKRGDPLVEPLEIAPARFQECHVIDHYVLLSRLNTWLALEFDQPIPDERLSTVKPEVMASEVY